MIDEYSRNYQKYEFLQLTSTKMADFWAREFGWILHYKDLDFKVISDMVRYENGNPNYIAGIELMKIFYNEYGLTTPILIFCGNRERALQNIKDNKVREDRVFKVAIEEEEV